MMKLENKRGELTTQQLVTIIILVVSFAVILILIFRLNLGETTQKEICHNSVLMKAKVPLSSQLDCKTNYVCISGGGECEGFNEDYTVEVDMNAKDTKEQIMKAIADEMADCWWMFGEGKVDYVGLDPKNLALGEVNCALCSRIKFSKDIQDLKTIDSNPFKQFLANNEKSKGVSYLYYLYKTYNPSEMNIGEIDLTKEQYVLTGIGKVGVLKGVVNWFASGFDAFNKLIGFSKLTTSKFKDYGSISVIIKEKEKLDDVGCDQFLTKA